MKREEKQIYDLWLDGLWEWNPKNKIEFCETFGSSKEAYRKVEGKDLRIKKEFSTSLEKAKAAKENMKEKAVWAFSYDDPEYPQLLREIQNPPWMIYGRGDVNLLRQPAVAVVGARRASEYGIWVAKQLGKRISASGAVLVSGMAFGIDAAAHWGALEEKGGKKGKTIAVFGCGIDICYPKANQRLMEEIGNRGLLLSEFGLGIEPRPYYFPMRNRLISGLSRGVVVAEAGLASGSLITAELAAEQGREVFAVPGNINRPGAMGTNKLIKDGVIPVVVIDDVLEELGMKSQGNEAEELLGKDEQIVYQAVRRNGELSADQLSVLCDFSIGKMNGIVTILEMKGLLCCTSGKIYIAKL